MKRKQRICITTAVMVFLLALGLMLYPIISTRINAHYASEIQTSYEAVIEDTDNSELIVSKEAAIRYNESITPGATDTNAYSQEALLAASQNYEDLLNIAGDGIMAYVQIPKIDVQLPVYHGTNNDSLDRGIGHLLGSSLPVGGESRFFHEFWACCSILQYALLQNIVGISALCIVSEHCG